MTDNDGGSGQERRLEERTECDIEACIELSDRLAIACRVRDLSGSGVRIQIDESIYLSNVFDLLVPVVDGVNHRHRVRVVWRVADFVGGEFLTPLAQ